MEYGFLSLVPPLLTIALALLTKNVFLSLSLFAYSSFAVLVNVVSYIVIFSPTANDYACVSVST